jgi:hypothetical protein
MSSDSGKTAAYREAMTAIWYQRLLLSLKAPTYRRYKDEQRLEDLNILREEVEPEIDEDKIFRKLGQHCKHVLRCPLSPLRHGMVRVVLERDSAEQQGDDTCTSDRVHSCKGMSIPLIRIALEKK